MESSHVQMSYFYGYVLKSFARCVATNRLLSSEISLADAGSLSTGPSADSQVGFEIGRLPKPAWRICALSSGAIPDVVPFDLFNAASLARIIVYSIAQDGHAVASSNVPTPLFTPLPSGMNTPQVQSSTLKEFLSTPLGNKGPSKPRVYLAGSKALESLARLIASTESFFHPSNSGAWTSDVCEFVDRVLQRFLSSREIKLPAD